MRKSYGFTLIEVMITVVIVAILASVAIPSYTEYVKKARRTEARTTLLAVAAGMEKFLLANNTYPADIDTLVTGGGSFSGVGSVGLLESGGYYYSVDRNYRIARNSTDDPTRGWRLQATPASSAAQRDTDCYHYNLYQNGEWRVQNNSNAFLTGAAADACLPD